MDFDLHDTADLIRERLTDLYREADRLANDEAHEHDIDHCNREIRQWGRALEAVRNAEHELNTFKYGP